MPFFGDVCTYILSLCDKNIVSGIDDNLDEILEFLLKCASQNNASLIESAAECWESFDLTDDTRKGKIYSEFLKKLVGVLYDQIHKVNPSPKHLEVDIYDIFEKDVRRSSVDALEFITRIHGPLVCEVILPLIEENLLSMHLLVKESSILALGVLAQSNTKIVESFFNEHTNYLISVLDVSEPIVQMTTLWTLSKYFALIVPNEALVTKLLDQTIKLMTSKDTQVHHASLSLLMAILEILSNTNNEDIAFSPYPQRVNAKPFLANYERILEAIWKAIHMYKDQLTVGALYDVIASLFDFVRGEREPPTSKFIEMIFLEMLQRVSTLTYDDEASACLSSLAALSSCYPDVFVLHSTLVVNTCTQIIQDIFDDTVYRDILISCLDFLSEVVQHLDLDILNKNFFVTYTIKCLESGDLSLSQSGFGLLGELMKHDAFAFNLEVILPYLETSIQEFENFSNNAIWAFGEIATKRCDDSSLVVTYTKKLIPKIIEKLIITGNSHLRETISMTLGKIGLCFGKEMSSFVPQFFDIWCETILQSMDTRTSQSDVDALNNALVIFGRDHPSCVVRNIPKICVILKKEAWKSRFNIDVLLALYALKRNTAEIEFAFKQNHIEFQPVVRLQLIKNNLQEGNFADVILKFIS